VGRKLEGQVLQSNIKGFRGARRPAFEHHPRNLSATIG
jgi:hypothetical protein